MESSMLMAARFSVIADQPKVSGAAPVKMTMKTGEETAVAQGDVTYLALSPVGSMVEGGRRLLSQLVIATPGGIGKCLLDVAGSLLPLALPLLAVRIHRLMSRGPYGIFIKQSQ
jgi:hypothetical protein